MVIRAGFVVQTKILLSYLIVASFGAINVLPFPHCKGCTKVDLIIDSIAKAGLGLYKHIKLLMDTK